MSPSVGDLSASKLRDLKSGETIGIRYATSQNAIDNGTSHIIYEQFPKRVATAFSPIWAELFPSINKISLQDLSRPKRTTVTVVGGDKGIIRSILSWMISCCEGRGIVPYPLYPTRCFYNYFLVKQSADNMGIKILSQEMNHRLNQIGSKQIHSEDVRAMYLALPAGHPVLKDIAAHIADLISTRKLRAFGAYKTVRGEIPEFDTDVNALLVEKYGANPAGRKLYTPQAQQPTKIQHTTISCPIVHKAKKGRPAFAKLSLADAGVNKDEFTGDAFVPPPARKPHRGRPTRKSNLRDTRVVKTEHKNLANGKVATATTSDKASETRTGSGTALVSRSPTRSSELTTPTLTSASVATASSVGTPTVAPATVSNDFKRKPDQEAPFS